MRRLVILMVALIGCAADAPADDHEAEDFQVDPADGKADGVAATFDQNTVVTNEMFDNGYAMEVADLQAFFEATPYNNRSWLASATVDGVSAAQAVIDAAHAQNVNPLLLVARMQVETSLVSKTVQPSQRLIDRALGCGCPDGGTCSGSYKGLGPQLTCGAVTLRKWYDASAAGEGQWRRGLTAKTLDGKRVTPSNDATASFYSYTPWVLVGSGGTWLAWNVTRKYVRHADAMGLTHAPN